MKKTTFEFDLYRIYERTLDGCVAIVEIEYDLNDMINNKITPENLKLISVKVEDDYVKSGPFDIDEIVSRVKSYLSDQASFEEDFAENMPDSEWALIEHHWA